MFRSNSGRNSYLSLFRSKNQKPNITGVIPKKNKEVMGTDAVITPYIRRANLTKHSFIQYLFSLRYTARLMLAMAYVQQTITIFFSTMGINLPCIHPSQDLSIPKQFYTYAKAFLPHVRSGVHINRRSGRMVCQSTTKQCHHGCNIFRCG